MRRREQMQFSGDVWKTYFTGSEIFAAVLLK